MVFINFLFFTTSLFNDRTLLDTQLNTLTSTPFIEIKSTSSSEKIKDYAMTPQGQIYVVHLNNPAIVKYNSQGEKIKRIEKPGKPILESSAIVVFGENIIVADAKAKQLHVFKNDLYETSITLAANISPRFLAVVNQKLICTGYSINSFNGEIAIYGPGLDLIDTINPGIPLGAYDSRDNLLWTRVTLDTFENKLLIGFVFQAKAFILNDSGEVIQGADLSSFYETYASEKGEMIVPNGFAASEFGFSPNGQILVSVCDNNNRKCNQVYIFNQSMTQKLGVIELENHIWTLDYLPEHKMFATIDSSRNLRFFKTK